MTDPFADLPKGHYGAIYAPPRILTGEPREALELGKAAEHLVCADLILQGYRCYLSDQGLPYDVVADVGGQLIRIQVKATLRPRNMNAQGRSVRLGYNFNVRRRGRNGDARLTELDCDIVALVALDIKVIAYLPVRGLGMTCQLMPPGYIFSGKIKRSRVAAIDGFPFQEAVRQCRS